MVLQAEYGLALVDVAVPVPLRTTFTYKLPPDLDPREVAAGRRVLVPFRAKLLHGVTMGPARGPKEDENTARIRALISYDPRRILEPEIHKLLDWVVHYYKAPPGEAVKLMLPPGLLNQSEPLFRLTEDGEDRLGTLGEADRPLLLLSRKAVSRKAWEHKAQTKLTMQDLRRWEQAGFLEIVAEGRERDTVPHVTALTLTTDGSALDLDTLKRAKKQRAILEWLRRQSKALVEVSEINEHFKSPSAAVTALVERGLVLRERVPKHELALRQTYVEPDEVKVLTPEQDVAYRAVIAALDDNAFKAFLMFGVTGAGKTEVYLRAIQDCLKAGKQALFLVPEIALTPLMQRRIMDRFGDRLAILHSAVGAGRRNEDWAKVLAGKVDVVLGARSGIFAPLPRLGLVIVDEEHDQSYKQNDGIRYHARDLALVRAKRADAVVVMGSATPSLESWRNQQRGRSTLLTLKQRATKAKLPTVEIVDMREEFKAQRKRPLLSRLLAHQIEATLEEGRQVMILLNRRGYFSFLLCRKCGEAVMCSQCEVSMTYHRTDNTLKCHYCTETIPIPKSCPSCGEPGEMMQFFGEGTQQVQEILQKQFPNHVVDRLDRDRLTKREAGQEILDLFGKGKTHILVGTQMIAKGHDFPNVTLVGILNADMGLRIPDFRCAEVTFQLLTQVAGRSGRGQNPGSVVIQTYMPEHYSITCASQHDFLGFLDRELVYREHLFYSPFAHMVAILITDEDEGRAAGVAGWMTEQLAGLRRKESIVVLGPARAPIGKIKNAWRFQIVLKAANRTVLHRLADAVVEEVVKRKLLPRTAVIMDIDPYQFF